MADSTPPRAMSPIPSRAPPVQLRLYIARSTPNSVRAEHNLAAALEGFDAGLVRPDLEIIDVFTQPKRAIVDGVVVTPTLVGSASGRRVVLMGDLADRLHLRQMLEQLSASDGPPARR